MQHNILKVYSKWLYYVYIFKRANMWLQFQNKWDVKCKSQSRHAHFHEEKQRKNIFTNCLHSSTITVGTQKSTTVRAALAIIPYNRLFMVFPKRIICPATSFQICLHILSIFYVNCVIILELKCTAIRNYIQFSHAFNPYHNFNL